MLPCVFLPVYADHLFIFSRGLRCVLEDPSFKIMSPANQCALRTGSALSVWCSDTTNHDKLADFVRVLTIRLAGCFTSATLLSDLDAKKCGKLTIN